MKNKILCCFSLLFLTITVSAQEAENNYFDVGLEIQQYPTGFLYGARAEIGLSKHQALDFRVGYNALDHKDFGKHDSEIGGGFGFSVGYRYYFKSDHRKWFIGARTDLWFNEVDWEEFEFGAINNGTTDVIVLQPTAIAGYLFLLNESWVLTPTLAFGAEINIKTKGEAVGEGAIVLWGINLARRF